MQFPLSVLPNEPHNTYVVNLNAMVSFQLLNSKPSRTDTFSSADEALMIAPRLEKERRARRKN